MKKETEVSTVLNDEALALLRSLYPQDDAGYNRIFLPRISFKAQDVMEGTGKNKKVVIAAGTFFTERETEETDDNGKKIWNKEEIGAEMDGIIIYKRRQLRMYDESTEEYSSTPIFDTEHDVVPLFCAKKEVARGTASELKALYEYEYTDDKGATKKRSKLQDNAILYVLKDGELFQLNLHGSSMYSFSDYNRKVLVSSVVTHFSSEYNKNGSIEWNKMTFAKDREITGDELMLVVEKTKEIIDAVNAEKAYFAGVVASSSDDHKTPPSPTGIEAPKENDDF